MEPPSYNDQERERPLETLNPVFHDLASIASAVSTIEYLLGVAPPDVEAARRLAGMSLTRLTKLMEQIGIEKTD